VLGIDDRAKREVRRAGSAVGGRFDLLRPVGALEAEDVAGL